MRFKRCWHTQAHTTQEEDHSCWFSKRLNATDTTYIQEWLKQQFFHESRAHWQKTLQVAPQEGGGGGRGGCGGGRGGEGGDRDED